MPTDASSPCSRISARFRADRRDQYGRSLTALRPAHCLLSRLGHGARAEGARSCRRGRRRRAGHTCRRVDPSAGRRATNRLDDCSPADTGHAVGQASHPPKTALGPPRRLKNVDRVRMDEARHRAAGFAGARGAAECGEIAADREPRPHDVGDEADRLATGRRATKGGDEIGEGDTPVVRGPAPDEPAKPETVLVDRYHAGTRAGIGGGRPRQASGDSGEHNEHGEAAHTHSSSPRCRERQATRRFRLIATQPRDEVGREPAAPACMTSQFVLKPMMVGVTRSSAARPTATAVGRSKSVLWRSTA
jgi:hypothetical protein